MNAVDPWGLWALDSPNAALRGAIATGNYAEAAYIAEAMGLALKGAQVAALQMALYAAAQDAGDTTGSCPTGSDQDEVILDDFLEGDDVAEAGDHARDVGEVTGIVDRPGKAKRRRNNLKGHPTVEGKDRDEYPPSVIKPDNPDQVSVRTINRSHNRRSGARLRHKLPPDGTRVRIIPPQPNR